MFENFDLKKIITRARNTPKERVRRFRRKEFLGERTIRIHRPVIGGDFTRGERGGRGGDTKRGGSPRSNSTPVQEKMCEKAKRELIEGVQPSHARRGVRSHTVDRERFSCRVAYEGIISFKN